MKNITESINIIIEDLVEPSKQLKDILLKVQVLAFQLKNDKLKEWVSCELNGYAGKEIPNYRKISTAIIGNLIQNRGFGGYAYRKNHILSIEFLEEKYRDHLNKALITSTVAELEKMKDKEDSEYMIAMPQFIQKEISRSLTNGWQVDSAWQNISKDSIEGILSSIRSTLLQFLLEINSESGENNTISIMERKKNVEKAFDKTIGSITGETINVTVGNENLLAVNKGQGMNVARGNNNSQEISSEIKSEISAILDQIRDKIDEINLGNEEKEEVKIELQRVETQLRRTEPKKEIINGALNIIYQIMVEVTANAYTPIILEKLGKAIQYVS